MFAISAAPGTSGPPSGVGMPVVVLDSESTGTAGSSEESKVGLWTVR